MSGIKMKRFGLYFDLVVEELKTDIKRGVYGLKEN